jgi:hypothetical protein
LAAAALPIAIESSPTAVALPPVLLLMPMDAAPVAVALSVAAPSKTTPSLPAKAGVAAITPMQSSAAAIAVVARKRMGEGVEESADGGKFVRDDM